EQAWIAASGHGDLSLAALRDLHGRGLALAEALVATLPPGALEREGNANGIDITAGEVLGYFIAHEQHHLQVLRERY
ncbi:MAG TPA: DinB family protein, partial [Fibrobacteria bacterium]|nr:DinB family protein [Fibrobacteria bacterium]